MENGEWGNKLLVDPKMHTDVPFLDTFSMLLQNCLFCLVSFNWKSHSWTHGVCNFWLQLLITSSWAGAAAQPLIIYWLSCSFLYWKLLFMDNPILNLAMQANWMPAALWRANPELWWCSYRSPQNGSRKAQKTVIVIRGPYFFTPTSLWVSTNIGTAMHAGGA